MEILRNILRGVALRDWEKGGATIDVIGEHYTFAPLLLRIHKFRGAAISQDLDVKWCVKMKRMRRSKGAKVHFTYPVLIVVPNV